MQSASITSADSFLARAQQSEARRIALWLGVLAALIVVTVTRRAFGGLVMSTDAVFYLTLAILLAASALQVVLLSILRRANREMRLLPSAVWRGSAIADLAVPSAMMAVSAWFSPRGALVAISAPPLLVIPLVVLMSVLRLRPRFTLGIGLAGAAFHAVLVARAIEIHAAAVEQYPVLFAYDALLVLIAFAGMFVARQVKNRVLEAAQEATAHEQAQRQIATVQRDLSIARDIQAGLLPAGSPRFDGFQIAGMNRPADMTGGDYYDWQELPDGRLAIVLADVTGHGIGPAIVMAVCRAYARASANVIREPDILMARLNELLSADLPADRFITFALAMLQRDGTVEFVSAGHGPTFLYRAATGEIAQFGGDGLPLGVAASERYEPVKTLQLQSNDVLVMLTDGFFEWQRPSDGEAFGIDRLANTVLQNVHCEAEAIIKSLDAAVRAFADGSPQPDDMTVVVIKRR